MHSLRIQKILEKNKKRKWSVESKLTEENRDEVKRKSDRSFGSLSKTKNKLCEREITEARCFLEQILIDRIYIFIRYEL